MIGFWSNSAGYRKENTSYIQLRWCEGHQMSSFVWSHNPWKEAQQPQRHISRRLEGIWHGSTWAVADDAEEIWIFMKSLELDDFSDQLKGESDRWRGWVVMDLRYKWCSAICKYQSWPPAAISVVCQRSSRHGHQWNLFADDTKIWGPVKTVEDGTRPIQLMVTEVIITTIQRGQL